MKMKNAALKKIIGAALTAALMITSVTPFTASADGRKVVTLGADLNESQRNSILKYFGILGQNIDTIYITNQDERNMLGSYISLEQIGTHTYSCAYVQPTTSGGIHVKTANLNYVTSNMIASALSTSGVKNCDVIAASPFEVSGTGALTGVMMAYETAMGSVLDESKKQTASQEIVTTGKVAETVGQAQATKVVNDIKIKVIEEKVDSLDKEKIQEIVDEAVAKAMEEMTAAATTEIEVIPFSEEDVVVLGELAEKIAEQEYEYEDMRETLERVEQNVSSEISEELEEEEISTYEGEISEEDAMKEDVLDEDSILMNTDDSALGDDVIIDATNEEALQDVETLENEEDTWEDDPFEIVTGDEDTFDTGDTNTTDTYTADTNDTDTFEDEYTYDTLDETTNPDIVDNADDIDDIETFDNADDYDEGTDEIDEFGETDTLETGDTISDGASVEATFTADGQTPTFGAFSTKLYVDGDYVPASGSVILTDSTGDIADIIDLEDTNTWGVRTAAEAGVTVSGYTDANEIQIFTSNLALYDSKYNVSADIVFASNENGSPAAGTETAPVQIEADMTYEDSYVFVSDPANEGFKAGSYIDVSAGIPEDAAYAEITSSDPGVAYVEDSYGEGESVTAGVMLATAGDVTFTATYYDGDGNEIGEDSIRITVF